MKYGAVIVPLIHVAEKILNRDGRLIGEKLDSDIAIGSFHQHNGVACLLAQCPHGSQKHRRSEKPPPYDAKKVQSCRHVELLGYDHPSCRFLLGQSRGVTTAKMTPSKTASAPSRI